MTTDRFKDGIQWWMDTTRPMSEGLFPNPPQWHIDTGKLVRLVPQRPWVSLTDEEIDKKYWAMPRINKPQPTQLEFAHAIEQMLKEKNNA